MADKAEQLSALRGAVLHLDLALAQLSDGVATMKVARRMLHDADPNARSTSPIGISQSEVFAFTRRMAEAVAFLNGMRGGISTANRLRNIIKSLEE